MVVVVVVVVVVVEVVVLVLAVAVHLFFISFFTHGNACELLGASQRRQWRRPGCRYT